MLRLSRQRKDRPWKKKLLRYFFIPRFDVVCFLVQCWPKTGAYPVLMAVSLSPTHIGKFHNECLSTKSSQSQETEGFGQANQQAKLAILSVADERGKT